MLFYLEIFIYVVLFCVIIKKYLQSLNGKFDGTDRLDDKTVIVTGADSGIGLICCIDFAKRGAKVIMISCNIQLGKKMKEKVIFESGNKNVKVKYLDFSSLKTVRKCAYEIMKEEPKIHILLNNAGAMKIGIYETEDKLDALKQINYFGPFLFTNILLGKLKESTPSRIVNVSSIAQIIARFDVNTFKSAKSENEWISYGNTKFALTCFTNELAKKLRGTGVTCNSLHPGAFPSGIHRTLPYHNTIIWSLFSYIFFKSIEEAAETSIYLCVSPDVKEVSGEFFKDCKLSSAPNRTKDEDLLKKLWKISEEAVDLQKYEKHY